MSRQYCHLQYSYPVRCFGAAAAKDRLDVIVRDAINAGQVPGPRSLANAREIAKPGGELCPGITRFADTPEGEMFMLRSQVGTSTRKC